MPTSKLPIGRWPEGGELFAETAKRNDPTLSDMQLYRLAVLLLDTPNTPVDATAWNPDSKGGRVRAVLGKETTIACLVMQAWSDRAQWALLCCPDAASSRNYRNGVRVLKSAVLYLPEVA